MPLEPVSGKIGEGGYNLPLDNPAVAAAIQKGTVEDIKKVLTELKIPPAALDEFLQNEFYRLQDLYKAEPAYAMAETVPAPSPEMFAYHDPANTLSEGDRAAFLSLIGKAMTSGKADGSKGDDQEAASKKADPNLDSAQDHLEEWNHFWDSVFEPTIFEAQLQQELTTKNAELERAFNELLAKARSGQVTDIELILALAKINVEKNGLIFTQLGKRIWNYNKQSVKVTDWLKQNTSSADMMAGQQQLKQINQSTTFLMNDMNAVAQNISSVITFLKSSLDAINTQKMEFARKTGLGS